MTNEQLCAFVAYGLLLEHAPEEVLKVFSINQIKVLNSEITKYLSPMVADDADLITPVLTVLQSTIKEVNHDTR